MAHGAEDDHLRLTVLLASALRERVNDAELYRSCTGPDTPWQTRREALKQFLEHAQRGGGGTLIRLVDPDALDMGDPSQEGSWDDASFRRERSEFFAILLDRFAHNGWELIRPEPQTSTTAKLDARGCELVVGDAPSGGSADEERLQAVADASLLPAIRPLADALVVNNRLGARELARMLESVQSPSDANDLVLEIAYDVLSVDAIEAGKRLALLRGPQVWNCVAGFFSLRDRETGWTERLDSVPREAARELAQGGWLQIGSGPGGGSRFAMANAIRSFFLERATTTAPERVQAEHTWLARRTPGSVEESVEVHFHAVESGDGALAERTARHYGADLRRIAFALSTKKDASETDFKAAADIYRAIVNKFDKEDAYAWEYLGYNLARAYGGRDYPPAIEREITEAYANACRYDPQNPLYKGREIGFAASLGRQQVKAELRRALERFRRIGGNAAVGILGQHVLRNMSDAVLLDLAGEPWAAVLLRLEETRGFFR